MFFSAASAPSRNQRLELFSLHQIASLQEPSRDGGVSVTTRTFGGRGGLCPKTARNGFASMGNTTPGKYGSACSARISVAPRFDGGEHGQRIEQAPVAYQRPPTLTGSFARGTAQEAAKWAAVICTPVNVTGFMRGISVNTTAYSSLQRPPQKIGDGFV